MPARAADVLLAAFAVLVLTGAYIAVTDDGSAPQAATVAATSAATTPTTAPTTAPTATPTPSPTASAVDGTPDGAPAGAPVLLVGTDLTALAAPLSDVLSRDVVTAKGTDELAGVTAAPAAVVLEITAGSQTTVRTRAAVTAVKTRFPGVPVLVVGPFSSGDRKSAASAKAGATALGATFLDPVEAGWRTDATAAALSADDVPVVARQLADDVRAAVG